jgi:hypothetical protein
MDVTQKWQSSSGFPSLAPLATAAYAAFLKESRMELANAANINRKSGSQSSLLANCYTPVYHAQAVFGLKGFCGVALFNFEREFSAESNLVVSQAAEQSCEQQQRDVYESHRHRTFSLAFYMTGNEIEAEEILATTFIRAFQQNERPDAFAVDSALVNELSQRFPLKEEQAAAVISPGSSLSHRNVRRPDLEIAVRSLPANACCSCCVTSKAMPPRPSPGCSIFPSLRCFVLAFPPVFGSASCSLNRPAPKLPKPLTSCFAAPRSTLA